MPTLTPCLRKPAAEAEAEIDWLAGWLDGWLVWETSRTRLGEPPPDVSQRWAGASWRGGPGMKKPDFKCHLSKNKKRLFRKSQDRAPAALVT